MRKIFRFFRSLYWFHNDRCYKCGGKIYVWEIRKAVCEECGTSN